MKVAIKHNASKNGFEVKFPSKPDPKTIDLLKSGGFKYSGDGQFWWSVITSDSVDIVKQLADNPVCSSCMDSVSVLKRFHSILGKTIDEPIINPLHADLRAIIEKGNSDFHNELKELDRILWLMSDSIGEHGKIVPKLGDKQAGLKALLNKIAKSQNVKTGNDQYALFGIPKSTYKKKPKGKKN